MPNDSTYNQHKGEYWGRTTSQFESVFSPESGFTSFQNSLEVYIIKNKHENCKSLNMLADIRRDMLYVIRPKACKKCGGNLALECDVYGVYIQCIQCGATWNKDDIVLANTRDNVKNGKVVKTRPLVTATDQR